MFFGDSVPRCYTKFLTSYLYVLPVPGTLPALKNLIWLSIMYLKKKPEFHFEHLPLPSFHPALTERAWWPVWKR